MKPGEIAALIECFCSLLVEEWSEHFPMSEFEKNALRLELFSTIHHKLRETVANKKPPIA